MSRFTTKDQVELFNSAGTMISIASGTLQESSIAVMLALEELDDVEEQVDPKHHRSHILELLRMAQEAVTEAITAVSITTILAARKRA